MSDVALKYQNASFIAMVTKEHMELLKIISFSRNTNCCPL